jgi:hypothetical protein
MPRTAEQRSLPGVLNEIADVIGVAGAISLAQKVGGTRIYIPGGITAQHWLVDAIGLGPAEKLCAKFSRSRIDIPLGPAGAMVALTRQRAETVRAMTDEGLSAPTIARRIGVSVRTVCRIRSKMRPR